MAAKFLLFILPSLVAATINIEITGPLAKDPQVIKMNLYGRQMHVISDIEMNSFHLNDETLIRAVETYTGKRPTDVFLRSPTPWGDLYDTYNWQQVVHTLEPRNSKIVSVNQEPTTITSQTFENNLSEATTHNVAVSDVLTSVISSWSEDALPMEDIEYSFDIEMMKHQPLSFRSTWGMKNSSTHHMMAAPAEPMNLLLQPHSAVISELQATKVTLRMEIPLKSSLHGLVAVHFEDQFKGHDFWAFAVEKVMRSAKLINDMVGKHIVEISFHVNPKVVVIDKETRVKLMEKSL